MISSSLELASGTAAWRSVSTGSTNSSAGSSGFRASSVRSSCRAVRAWVRRLDLLLLGVGLGGLESQEVGLGDGPGVVPGLGVLDLLAELLDARLGDGDARPRLEQPEVGHPHLLGDVGLRCRLVGAAGARRAARSLEVPLPVKEPEERLLRGDGDGVGVDVARDHRRSCPVVRG